MEVDLSCGQGEAFQECAISNHGGTVELQSGFAAIPGDESVDGVFIAPL
jgi:hypothetical protein